MNLNPTFMNSNVAQPAALSPSCIRHYISRNVFRYNLYKMKVIPSPAMRGHTTPSVPLMSPSSARKAKSPGVKKTHVVNSVKCVVTPIPAVPEPRPVARFAAVHFKYESGYFLAPFRVAEGDRVVVEGDRGTHFGTVMGITTDKPEQEIVRRVLRRATATDLEAYQLQREHEIEAASVAGAIAQSCRLHKDATIVDAEFQFDGQKLTIYVERPSKQVFVDFRKLQRGLYKEYHCRIWCAYLDEILVDYEFR